MKMKKIYTLAAVSALLTGAGISSPAMAEMSLFGTVTKLLPTPMPIEPIVSDIESVVQPVEVTDYLNETHRSDGEVYLTNHVTTFENGVTGAVPSVLPVSVTMDQVNSAFKSIYSIDPSLAPKLQQLIAVDGGASLVALSSDPDAAVNILNRVSPEDYDILPGTLASNDSVGDISEFVDTFATDEQLDEYADTHHLGYSGMDDGDRDELAERNANGENWWSDEGGTEESDGGGIANLNDDAYDYSEDGLGGGGAFSGGGSASGGGSGGGGSGSAWEIM